MTALVRNHAVAVGALLALLCAAAGAALLEPSPSWVMLVGAVLAAAFSVVRPDRIGSIPPITVLLVGWLAGYGTDTVAPLGRTVGFALLLVVVHECATLAAAVPAFAYCSAAVARRWLTRLAPEAVAVLLAAGAVAVMGRYRGSPAADVLGVAAVVGVLAALAWLAYSTAQREMHESDRRG